MSLPDIPVPVPVPVKRRILEKHVEAYFVRQAEKFGGKSWKWASMNVRGVADRILVMPCGEIYIIEIKKDHRSPLSKHQKSFFAKLQELGVTNAFVVRGKDGVDQFFESIGYMVVVG